MDGGQIPESRRKNPGTVDRGSEEATVLFGGGEQNLFNTACLPDRAAAAATARAAAVRRSNRRVLQCSVRGRR